MVNTSLLLLWNQTSYIYSEPVCILLYTPLVCINKTRTGQQFGGAEVHFYNLYWSYMGLSIHKDFRRMKDSILKNKLFLKIHISY